VGVGVYVPRSIQTGNGSTKEFSVPFGIEDEGSLEVYYAAAANPNTETLLSSPADYTITALSTSSVTVLFTTAPAYGSLVSFSKIADYNQPNDYANWQIYNRNQQQRDWDRNFLNMQAAYDRAGRAPQMRETRSGAIPYVNEPVEGALTYWKNGDLHNLAPGSNGDLVGWGNGYPVSITGLLLGSIPVSAYMEPALLAGSAVDLAGFVDHGGLIGLADDDHTQYLLVDGTRAMSGTLDMADNAIGDVAYMDFNLVNGTASAEGRLVWNPTDGTLNLGMPGGSVNLQIGQEILLRGKNLTGTSTPEGKAVLVAGASGFNPEFYLTDPATPNRAGTTGLFTENVGTNALGYVTTFGRVRDLDTSGTPVGEVWADGDYIFASATPGELTNVQPIGSGRKIFIGTVLRAHASEGVLWVDPTNQPFIEGLSGNDDGAGNPVISVAAAGVTIVAANDDATYTGIITTDSGLLKYRTKAQLASDLGVLTDHGALAGLADDDHSQYLLVSGTRGMTGDLDMSGNGIGSAGLIVATDLNVTASLLIPAVADDATYTGILTLDSRTPKYRTKTQLAGDLVGSIDHNSLLNTHNLTTDIDHASITNTHNLTTDIDHATITNGHNLTTDIDHATITNGHNLTTDIDHDAILNFVANEHINHTSVTLTAGSGLTGGGDISANRTFNVGAGTGITVAADSISTNDSAIVHDNLSGFVANEHINHASVSITAGSGLTGGGTIAANRTINVGAGTGISVAADSISTNDGAIVHDNLSGFVANEHINHTSVSITAGSGLTGGGTIAANRTINVGASTGITVNADNIALTDIASGSTTHGALHYNGTTRASGQFYGGSTNPNGSNRLNYSGYFYPTYINLTASGDTTGTPSHAFVETGSDGYVRPMTWANFQNKITDVGTLTSLTVGGELTVTGSINAANGTAGNPSYSFTSETDTGMYYGGTGLIGWSLNGTVKLWLDGNTNDLSPATIGGMDLGASGLHWNHLYCNEVYLYEGSHYLILDVAADLTADHSLTFDVNNANRILYVHGNAQVDQNTKTSASPTFAGLTLSAAGSVFYHPQSGDHALGTLKHLAHSTNTNRTTSWTPTTTGSGSRTTISAFAALLPTNTTAVLVTVEAQGTSSTSGGTSEFRAHFWSNNTFVPAFQTMHPKVAIRFYPPVTGENNDGTSQIIIPVDGSKYFYTYCSLRSRISSTTCWITLNGYYI
jgi:hypothetical protein